MQVGGVAQGADLAIAERAGDWKIGQNVASD
jgi:hypothetical protein